VLSTCSQYRLSFTRRPVSSAWATGAAMSARRIALTGASRRVAATRTARWRVPGEIPRPASSLSTPAVRRSVAIFRETRNGVHPISGAKNQATAMAFGGLRSSCVRPGAHSARRQDSRNDLTPCRMALHFISAGAHAPHSDETPGPTATRGSSVAPRSSLTLPRFPVLLPGRATTDIGSSRPQRPIRSVRIAPGPQSLQETCCVARAHRHRFRRQCGTRCTLRWISTSTTWRHSASTVAAIPVPQRPQAQVPVNGMITHWPG